MVSDLNELYEPYLNVNVSDVLGDIDPDANILNELNKSQCHYYDEQSFQDEVVKNNDAEKCFSMLHFNIRSIQKNYENCIQFLHSLHYPFSIIGMSETWHTAATVDLYDLDDYKSVHKYRVNKKGGGVTLYIKNGIEFKVREDLQVFSPEVDALFVELEGLNAVSPASGKTIVGIIYRPPGTVLSHFNNEMVLLLSKIKFEKKLCFLLGDYNVNLLNHLDHKETSDFVNSLLSYSFYPLITKPTRIVNTSSTLIDNIFCSELLILNRSVNGLLYTDISDHLPIFCVIKLYEHKKQSDECLYHRPITQRGTQMFKSKIANTNWNDVLEQNDVQEAYTSFMDSISKAYMDSFPLRKKNGYHKGDKKPWLTDSLKHCIHVKNKLYLHYVKHPIVFNEMRYKVYKNTLRKVLRRAEKEHYDLMK